MEKMKVLEDQSLLRLATFSLDYGQEEKTAYVILPPGYDERAKDQTYPVLYMHDGQNLVSPLESGSQKTWQAIETLHALYEKKAIKPMIVAGLSHGREHRIYEYTPWVSESKDHGPTGGGQEHLDFFCPRF